MALSTVQEAKAQAGISPSDTSKDAQFSSYIDGVTSLVKNWLHRDIEMHEYTEYYSGDGSAILQLRQYPVCEVIGIWVASEGYFGQGETGDDFNNATPLVAGTDYALMSGQHGVGSSGRVRRINATWHGRPSRQRGLVANQPPLPNGNIKVQYTAGYSPVPASIKMAVNDLVIRKARFASVGGGVQSAGYEDASVGFFSPSDMASVFGSIEQALGISRAVVI